MTATEPTINPIEINRIVNKLSASAEQYFNDKDYKVSLDFIEAGLKADPMNHILHYKKSKLLYKMDSLHGSLLSLNKCLELVPTYELAIKGIRTVEKKIAMRYTHRIYR